MRIFSSIRFRLLAVMLLTTFCALFVAGISILIYDISAYRATRINDIETLAELIAFSSTPALQFGDEAVAKENLALLQIRPAVSAAALYDARGRIFASYSRGGEAVSLPDLPQGQGIDVQGNNLVVFQRLVSNGEILGTVFIRADYLLRDRVLGFVGILLLVALAAMAVAILLALWLRSVITRPILSIAGIARELVSRREYSRRAEKLSEDEVGELVDAFNAMLNEIEARKSALETTNVELEQEVAERKRAREEVLRLNEELEKTVQELQEAHRQKDDFLATLAHELRNPLAPIRSGLSVLPKADAAKRKEIFAILERQTRQLTHLVNDLMDVSRISRGKVSLKKEMVELDEALKNAIEGTHPLMEQKRHHFQANWPEESLLLYGDPVRLTQVFQNLLSNAAHYTPDGGNITLDVIVGDGEVEVVIRDDGIGMATDMLEKIFDPFIQVDHPLTKIRSGLGIGLTLARDLVGLHGGSIGADSEGPGKGTRFTVKLPLSSRRPAAREAEADGGGSRELKRRILVVDDNADVANTLAMALRMEGHEVQVALGGEEAMEAGAGFSPHIVLLDLGMPGMNGFEAARAMRGSDWGRHVTLVAVTGWGEDRHRAETSESGFDLHLVKPVTLEDLEKLLAGH